jgi:hypothetical protein
LASSVLLKRNDSRTDLRLFLAIARQGTVKGIGFNLCLNVWVL